MINKNGKKLFTGSILELFNVTVKCFFETFVEIFLEPSLVWGSVLAPVGFVGVVCMLLFGLFYLYGVSPSMPYSPRGCLKS